MVLFFTIVIPVLWYLFLKWSSNLYHSLYNKIGDLELRIVELQCKLDKLKK